MRQGGIRNVALVLVELARREPPARRDERLLEFVHHRRLADAGVPGHEHELGCAVCHDPFERAKQRPDLMLPAVERLRRHQTIRHVANAERERLYQAFRDVTWDLEEARSDFHRIAVEAGEHLAITSALLARDARAAVRAMTAHIRSGVTYWLQVSTNLAE